MNSPKVQEAIDKVLKEMMEMSEKEWKKLMDKPMGFWGHSIWYAKDPDGYLKAHDEEQLRLPFKEFEGRCICGN